MSPPGRTPENPSADRHEPAVDLAAVAADDALLDALAEGRTADGTGLTGLLAGWRREVHAEPVAELVGTDRALAVVAAARACTARPVPRGRHRQAKPAPARADRDVLGAAGAWACLAVVVLLLVVIAVRTVVMWLT